MTAGTIEEKIYHRQIFKQFLVNRVLKDPRQKRFFKSNDLYELFTLSEGTSDKTETSAIFAGTGSEVKVQSRKRRRSQEEDKSVNSASAEVKVASFAPKKAKPGPSSADVKLSLSRLMTEDAKEATSESERMREKIRKISQRIAEGKDKKKKEKKYKKMDGERISHLVKQRAYKTSSAVNQQEEEDKEPSSQEQDNYVLSKLLRKSGAVHSAVQHDVIVDGEGEDHVLIENEAERVAKEAVEELRRSRRECFRAEAGVPTWTGHNGALARKKPRFGAKKSLSSCSSTSSSSNGGAAYRDDEAKKFDGSGGGGGDRRAFGASDLLDRMRKRNKFLPSTSRQENNLFAPDNISGGGNSSISRVSRQQADLLADVRNFVAFQAASGDGIATTKELVEHFSGRIPPRDSPLFKSLLGEICTFEKKRDKGTGVWRLKPEFA